MSTPVFSSVMPTLPIRDLGMAIAFYSESLGFTLTFRNGSSFAIVTRGGVQLGLQASACSGIPSGQGRCYCKLSSGIDALYAEYRSRDVNILHELRHESYGMREFMISDSDENEINFGQPI